MKTKLQIVAFLLFAGCQYRNPAAEREQIRQQGATERAKIHQETIENVVPWTKHRREIKNAN